MWWYLEGVMGVRSRPMVWITLRPHTHRPAQMPTPPYSSSQMGVASLDSTQPLVYTIHSATSGPMALLQHRFNSFNTSEESLNPAWSRGQPHSV